eukprot:TRINITY_DN3625_c0_g3_i2.p1 TRINITY_DN3625_c0_g3~~TRINITY_DN3625_c0_g3_i2.p1  ORF type:complete len:349 (-),score=47.02 TRINITY_DN3625_c0_g3_i2:626-1672(-)
MMMSLLVIVFYFSLFCDGIKISPSLYSNTSQVRVLATESNVFVWTKGGSADEYPFDLSTPIRRNGSITDIAYNGKDEVCILSNETSLVGVRGSDSHLIHGLTIPHSNVAYLGSECIAYIASVSAYTGEATKRSINVSPPAPLFDCGNSTCYASNFTHFGFNNSTGSKEGFTILSLITIRDYVVFLVKGASNQYGLFYFHPQSTTPVQTFNSTIEPKIFRAFGDRFFLVFSNTFKTYGLSSNGVIDFGQSLLTTDPIMSMSDTSNTTYLLVLRDSSELHLVAFSKSLADPSSNSTSVSTTIISTTITSCVPPQIKCIDGSCATNCKKIPIKNPIVEIIPQTKTIDHTIN